MRPAVTILIFTTALIFYACREEIISPTNIAGNVNEPVKLNSNTSYSFSINADKISSNVSDSSPFYSLRSSCYVTILDHSSGSVQIIVAALSNHIMFNQTFTADISSFPTVFEGTSPQYIQLKFVNFTGKFRFELNKL
jgi:hypothetical protein